jgi:hypothetical protein
MEFKRILSLVKMPLVVLLILHLVMLGVYLLQNAKFLGYELSTLVSLMIILIFLVSLGVYFKAGWDMVAKNGMNPSDALMGGLLLAVISTTLNAVVKLVFVLLFGFILVGAGSLLGQGLGGQQGAMMGGGIAGLIAGFLLFTVGFLIVLSFFFWSIFGTIFAGLGGYFAKRRLNAAKPAS